MKSKLFKLPKHRSFSFTPRYYNEDKERLKQRRKELVKELNISEQDAERNIRIKEQFSLSKPYNNTSSKWSNIRLLVIFGVLLIAFYYVYINLDTVLINITNSKLIK